MGEILYFLISVCFLYTKLWSLKRQNYEGSIWHIVHMANMNPNIQIVRLIITSVTFFFLSKNDCLNF